MADNKLNKKYTLEEHLRFLSIEDKDYEILYSIWDLNKKNLTQGLSLISSSFPHYSIHCRSHSKIFYLLNISELSTLKNVTANDLETSYILFLSQLCNIQRTL